MRVLPPDNLVRVAAPAKLNFFLELHGKRSDGFHEIETVIATVSLYDHLTVGLQEGSELALDVRLGPASPAAAETDSIPVDPRNLVWRAFARLRERAQTESPDRRLPGLRAVLTKFIPSAAGLGGASSDAAAALLAANQLWRLNWPRPRLAEVAAELGSDVPCFIYGGTTVCRGRGERVQPVAAPAGMPVVIVKPCASLSTARVFAEVDLETPRKSVDATLAAMGRGDPRGLARQLSNRLRPAADRITDEVREVQRAFERIECLGHQMSGSGSSYFGLFAHRRAAQRAAGVLAARHPNWRVFSAQTLPAQFYPAA